MILVPVNNLLNIVSVSAMADTENNLQPSKKRAAVVQLSKDNPGLDDDEDTSEQESGTFKRASDEVLASRRIVKVRRHQTSSTPSALAPPPASNPFAAIRLVPPPPPSAALEDEAGKKTEQIEKDDRKSENEANEPSAAVEVEASKKAEQIDQDDRKSENKEIEQKGQSTAEDQKNNVHDNNVKPSGIGVDESKLEFNYEEEADVVSKQSIAKSLVDKVSEDNISDNVREKAKEADAIENEAKKGVAGEKNDGEKGDESIKTEKAAETVSFSSFQQLSSSQNAFSGLAGTGLSSTAFTFGGSIPKDGSPLGSTTGSLFGFGVSNNGTSSVFGTSGTNIISNKSEGDKFPSMQEAPIETGEENEKAVFTADSALFEFIDQAWKERGKGELKVSVPKMGTGKARLIMRARGNYRLILNASLFPDMKLTDMDKKGVTFACVNSAVEGKDGLSTIALKFKDASILENFRAAVMEHKDNTGVVLKTPENSP